MKGKMKRVLIETQSNKIFRGLESEQDYDQRGGLCQVGEGDIIIVTNPFDSDFLNYWRSLGFSLPEIIVAGPFDKNLTLSQLIISKEKVVEKIHSTIGDSDSRLEFFWIEESERDVARMLGIKPYCNFDVSLNLACKHAFKKLCEMLGLKTAPWVGASSSGELVEVTKNFFDANQGVLIKASNGTGGTSLGCIRKIMTHDDLVKNIELVSSMLTPLVAEKMLDIMAEVSIHWEINDNGEVTIIDIFDQLACDFSYVGTAYPSILDSNFKDKITFDLVNKFAPYLLKLNAKGYFCCDILIDYNGDVFWTDFNPRKGAIIYVYDMAKRLAKVHFSESQKYYFWHEHFAINKGLCFRDIYNILSDILLPSGEQSFVVVTNPGVIRHGSLNLTGFSLASREEARIIMQKAQGRLA
jgi:hypothetical protein